MEYVLTHRSHIYCACASKCVCVHMCGCVFTSLTVIFSFQDTVSVHRPCFYADRFLKFMGSTVFRKLHRKKLRPHDDSIFEWSVLFQVVSLSLSFARSFFKEEEGLTVRREVSFSGGSFTTERGKEGGKESAKLGKPGWKLWAYNETFRIMTQPTFLSYQQRVFILLFI